MYEVRRMLSFKRLKNLDAETQSIPVELSLDVCPVEPVMFWMPAAKQHSSKLLDLGGCLHTHRKDPYQI